MSASVAFAVVGLPIGQAALRTGKTGKSYYPNGPKLRPWKKAIADAAGKAYGGRELLGTPLVFRARFRFVHPPSHYGSRKGERYLKADAPLFPLVDLTHLIRAAEDALKGVVYGDDKQVVRHVTEKVWADVEGASIEVAEWLP